MADRCRRGRHGVLDQGRRPRRPARSRAVRRRRALQRRTARRPGGAAQRLATARHTAGGRARRVCNSHDPRAAPTPTGAGRARRPARLPPPTGAGGRGPRRALDTANGVYRLQVTAADIRDAGAQGLGGVQAGVETLTLRDGHWRLAFTEPTGETEYGTYAGTPPRTAWFTDRRASSRRSSSRSSRLATDCSSASSRRGATTASSMRSMHRTGGCASAAEVCMQSRTGGKEGQRPAARRRMLGLGH